jgi:double-strand break repair protein MRE11
MSKNSNDMIDDESSSSHREGNCKDDEEDDADIFRILLSTDNHLGYCEKDSIRGNDSFAAFEEVLRIAKWKGVDFVLFSGDLFHENKPSRLTLHRTMEILRRYCMGPNAVRFRIVSDQAKNFRSSANKYVNFEDEFYSVDLPIFSIHGNHDDPTRDTGSTEMLAALDLLAVSNLVNYFGRQDEVNNITISPILMKKGDTKVALFGLGSMRDERLNRMWNEKNVKFMRPQVSQNRQGFASDEDETEKETGQWFNIFTLHQNRDLGRGLKNCIHESMIPEWMDLVVWGHEHECLIEPTESLIGTYRITQPGSSVATSLTNGESTRKKVGLLEVRGTQFRLTPIPLSQVRGFAIKEISLTDSERPKLDPADPRIDERVSDVLRMHVNELISNARSKFQELLQEAESLQLSASHNFRKLPELKYTISHPHMVLVRLKVEHSGFTALNNQRFGGQFVSEVVRISKLISDRREGRNVCRSMFGFKLQGY